MTLADSLGLKAKGKFQERLLKYLNENCSDVLAFKIQASDKTLAGAEAYLYEEVKNTIEKGKQKGAMCIAVEDEEVFGMLIHFFEEDSIKEPMKKKSSSTKRPEPVKPEPVDNTMVMDLFAGDEERPF